MMKPCFAKCLSKVKEDLWDAMHDKNFLPQTFNFCLEGTPDLVLPRMPNQIDYERLRNEENNCVRLIKVAAHECGMHNLLFEWAA